MVQRVAVPEEPIDGLELEIGGRAVKLNSYFTAGRDWLKGLKVKARNISDRPIVFAEIMLDVPKQGAMELPFGIPLRYGELPPLEPAPDSKQKHIPPGKVFKLSLSDQTFETVMSFLAERQVMEVVEVKMSQVMIIFDDGTAWNEGRRLRRDPSGPYRWTTGGDSGAAQTRRTIQKVSWKPPHTARARRAAADDVNVQCDSQFYQDYVLCGTVLGSNACTALTYSGRPQAWDDPPWQKQYLRSQTVPCEGANCSSMTRTVNRPEYDTRCGYAGGNQEQ